jgi:uncharacterized membrane protein (GlpM family)
MTFLIRFVVGGLVVAFVPIVMKAFGTRPAALLILFPVISFVSLVTIARSAGTSAVASTAAAGCIGLLTVLAFLGGIWLSARAGLAQPGIFAIGCAAWLAGAALFLSLG